MKAKKSFTILSLKMDSKPRSYTMPLVNFKRYMGDWHRLASTPFKWEANCVNSEVCYELNEDGTVCVINTCIMKCGKRESRRAIAKVIRGDEPGVLSIYFNDGKPNDGEGQYWIHWTDYDNFAIVGSPQGNVWILGRRKYLTKYEMDTLVAYIRRIGYQGQLVKPQGIKIVCN